MTSQIGVPISSCLESIYWPYTSGVTISITRYINTAQIKPSFNQLFIEISFSEASIEMLMYR